MFDHDDPYTTEFDFHDAIGLYDGDGWDDWPAELDFSDLDQYGAGEPPELLLDVPYVPTDSRIVEAMLDLAQVGRNDLLYDLGCGDGRIVVTAAMERGTYGIGIDMDPMRIDDARDLARDSMVEHLTHFVEADLLEADFSDATVVMLYLLDQVNLELRPRLLEELQPGTRIVSHAFEMADWKPDRRLCLNGINLYIWHVPAPVAGTWVWQNNSGDRYRITLKQKFQRLTGQAWINDQNAWLQRPRLYGDRLQLGIKPGNEDRPHNFVMRWKNGQLYPAGSAGGHDQTEPARPLGKNAR